MNQTVVICMTFRNIQVPLDALPAAEQLDFEPLSPAYSTEVMVQSLIIFSILLVVSTIPMFVVPDSAGIKPYLLWIPIGVALLAVLITWVAIQAAKAMGVALRDHDIAFRSGLIWRKTIILAFSRIQHVELSSGPLQRKFDLASLKFFTAGGLNVDMKIDGLRRDDAEQLRSSILARVASDD